MKRAGKRSRPPAKLPGQMELFSESASKRASDTSQRRNGALTQALKRQQKSNGALHTMLTSPALLDVRQAAARLGLSKSTLDKMRSRGVGPRFIKSTARAVRYDPKDLDAWVDERRRQSTDGA